MDLNLTIEEKMQIVIQRLEKLSPQIKETRKEILEFIPNRFDIDSNDVSFEIKKIFDDLCRRYVSMIDVVEKYNTIIEETREQLDSYDLSKD